MVGEFIYLRIQALPNYGNLAAEINELKTDMHTKFHLLGASKWLCTVFLFILCVSCLSENEDVFPNGNGNSGGQMGPGNMGGSSSVSNDFTLAGLTDMEIVLNTTALSETESIPADDEDFYENALVAGDFKGTINIHYNGTSDATVEGVTDGCSVTVDGGNVVVTATKAFQYVLSGSSDNGRFKIYSDKKMAILLDGVVLTYPTGSVINVQSKKRAYLVMKDGTTNTLTDGTTYITEYDPADATSAEKQKGTYYSKGQTILSGKGQLNIYAKYKHGIDTKDYLRIRKNTQLYVNANAGNCIKVEDTDEGGGFILEGGVLNLENSAAAGKGISSDGEITINGGRIIAICTGTGEWDGDDAEVKDVSGSAGIKSDLALTVNGGELWLKSTGAGGKGINSDSTITFNGGITRVITTGVVFTYTYNGKTYDTSPKGIKSDTDILVNSGEIYIEALGIKEGSEGMEAKQTYEQKGGKVWIYALDDGLNTGYSSDGLRDKQQLGFDISNLKANAGVIKISGGELLTASRDNDGMDSNGTISISGGVVQTYGAGAPETGFDCDQNTFSITGGTLFGMGGASPSTPTESQCAQPVLITNTSINCGTTYTLKDASKNTLWSVKIPRTYANGVALISSASLEKGGSYTWGDTSLSCSSSSWVTSTATNSGMGGGMMGGFR